MVIARTSRVVGLALFALAGVLLLPSSAMARGAGGSACHCPCIAECGGSVSCNCSGHSQSCHRCVCGSIVLNFVDPGGILETGYPTLQSSYSDWFTAAPFSQLTVAIHALMADTEREEFFKFELVPDPKQPMTYVPGATFDEKAYGAWRARVDRRSPGRVYYAAATDDPATYRILDGKLTHFNESLDKRFSIVTPKGSPVVVFKSDSTLEWEMWSYLRTAVAGMADEAFAEDAYSSRNEMYGMIDTVDLMVKASDFPGALAVLDDIENRMKKTWLDPEHADTRGLVCAFRKMRNLLAPDTATCS